MRRDGAVSGLAAGKRPFPGPAAPACPAGRRDAVVGVRCHPRPAARLCASGPAGLRGSGTPTRLRGALPRGVAVSGEGGGLSLWSIWGPGVLRAQPSACRLNFSSEQIV